MTQWNKPDDLHPWDYDPYWVCHMGVDGVPPATTSPRSCSRPWAARARSWPCRACWPTCRPSSASTGLKKALAELPDIELLRRPDRRVGPHQGRRAITEAFLAKYPDIDGIWAANDNMGLGALEALRAAKQATRTIPVVGIDGTSEAIQAVVDRRVRRHRHERPDVAGRHGPLAGLPGQERRVRSLEGAARAP